MGTHTDLLNEWLDANAASATIEPDPADAERVALTVHHGRTVVRCSGDDRDDASRAALALLGE